MENTVLTTTNTEITPEYQQAMDLHHRIVADIETAAAAMISLCRNLKAMRDAHLYSHLGYDSFEEYAEKAVGLKRRQAYNYIEVLEKLPSHLLQSNAHLGITKLELLAQVPALDREEFLGDNDMEGMSTREIKDILEKYKKQGEQLSLVQEVNEQLQEEKTRLQEDNRSLVDQVERAETVQWEEAKLRNQISEKDAEVQRLQKELEGLRSQPVEVAVQQPDEETLAKIREEAEQAAKADTDALLQEMERQKEAELEQAAATAREQAKQEAEQQIQAQLDALEQEKAQAMARAMELEKQLKTAGDSDTARLSALFDGLNGSFERIAGFVRDTKAADAEKGAKYQRAFAKALEQLQQRAEQM